MLVRAEQFFECPEAQKSLFNSSPSLCWTGAGILDRHKNCPVFVTMKMKVEFELQYARSLDSGFGLAIGARKWNEGVAEKNVRSRAAV